MASPAKTGVVIKWYLFLNKEVISDKVFVKYFVEILSQFFDIVKT